MDQRGKRLLTIAAIIILLFLGVAAYFIFFKKETSQNQATNVDKNLVPFNQRSPQINELPSTDGDASNPSQYPNHPSKP